MKRTLILIVALMVLLALAVPATAKPGKGQGSSPLEVTNDTDHFWANVADDVIVWSVFVTNRGDEALGTVVTDPVLTLISGDAEPYDSLDAGETWVYEYLYTVVADDLESDTITRTVDVIAGGHTTSTTLTVDTKPVAACAFDGGTLTYDEANPADAMLPCYYAFEKGYWKLTLTPTGEFGKKPINLGMTMRDGVPGNWCKISDGTGGFLEGSGVASTLWREGDPPLDLYVEFPDDGVCLHGGMGGETIGVNNPDIFILAAWGFPHGTITAASCTTLSFNPDGSIADCS